MAFDDGDLPGRGLSRGGRGQRRSPLPWCTNGRGWSVPEGAGGREDGAGLWPGGGLSQECLTAVARAARDVLLRVPTKIKKIVDGPGLISSSRSSLWVAALSALSTALTAHPALWKLLGMHEESGQETSPACDIDRVAAALTEDACAHLRSLADDGCRTRAWAEGVARSRVPVALGWVLGLGSTQRITTLYPRSSSASTSTLLSSYPSLDGTDVPLEVWAAAGHVLVAHAQWRDARGAGAGSDDAGPDEGGPALLVPKTSDPKAVPRTPSTLTLLVEVVEQLADAAHVA